MSKKFFANTILIILVVILAGALGYIILVKKPAPTEQSQLNNLQNKQPPVDTAGIDCGVTKDASRQSVQIACMSKALRACASAIMYDSKNPIAQESYEILGNEAQNCQVRHRQYTKPPQFSLVCKYPLDLISRTDLMLESQHESDRLFSIVVMQNGFSCK